MTDTALRATPRARVLTALELSRDLVVDRHADNDARDLELLLATLGVPEEVDLEYGRRSLAAAAQDLTEADQRRRDLELYGRDALDEDELPRGVSIARVVDDERERAYGEVDRLVEAIAGTLSP